MTFDEILDQVLELLQREGRLSYPALKLRFNLDDVYLDALKAELIDAKRLAADEVRIFQASHYSQGSPSRCYDVSTLRICPRITWPFLRLIGRAAGSCSSTLGGSCVG